MYVCIYIYMYIYIYVECVHTFMQTLLPGLAQLNSGGRAQSCKPSTLNPESGNFLKTLTPNSRPSSPKAWVYLGFRV